MGFFKKLFSGESAKPDKHFHTFNVKCNRCGEIIEGRIDLDNELSLSDEGDGFMVRKGLIGSGENRCFQQIEVTLKFSSAKAVIDEQIQGGTFVE
jgi:hypothetical protein